MSLFDLFEGATTHHLPLHVRAGCGWLAHGWLPWLLMCIDYFGPPEHCTRAILRSWSGSHRCLTSRLQAAHGLKVPWVFRAGSTFNKDFGVTTDEGETFGLSAFLRDAEDVYHTYFTTQRALEAVDTVFTLLDWTVLGRQEEWEDSPAGWPQTKPYEWWRRHDEY